MVLSLMTRDCVLGSKRKGCADIVRLDHEHGIRILFPDWNKNIFYFWFGIIRPISKFWDTTLFFNLGYVVVHDWRADR